MKYNVLFEDENYELYNVSLDDNMEEVWKSVSGFLEEMGVKVPYYRSWKNEKNELVIDYGSHSRFFIVREVF